MEQRGVEAHVDHGHRHLPMVTAEPDRGSSCARACERKWPAVACSGDKQAKTRLCRLETQEVAVTFDPPTRCEVLAEAPHRPLLGIRPDTGPHRDSATDVLVEVGLGPRQYASKKPSAQSHGIGTGSIRA